MKADLPEKFICSSLAFLGRSSFESRCVAAHRELADCNFKYKHFFRSKDESERAVEIRKELSLTSDEVSVIDVSDPLQTHKTIRRQIQKIVELPEQTSLVIDTTTFRREELLIFLKEMAELPGYLLDEASFVYSVATSWGRGSQET